MVEDRKKGVMRQGTLVDMFGSKGNDVVCKVKLDGGDIFDFSPDDVYRILSEFESGDYFDTVAAAKYAFLWVDNVWNCCNLLDAPRCGDPRNVLRVICGGAEYEIAEKESQGLILCDREGKGLEANGRALMFSAFGKAFLVTK